MFDASFVRFVLVGLSNTAIGFAVFHGAFAWLDHASVSQAIAYTCGIVWSYLLNSRWAFQGSQGSQGSSQTATNAPRFVALQILLLIITSVAIGVAVDRWDANPSLAWLIVMAISTAVNFLGCKYWVFADR